MSGISSLILEVPSNILPHLETTFFHNLRAYLSVTNTAIILEKSYFTTLKRIGDFHYQGKNSLRVHSIDLIDSGVRTDPMGCYKPPFPLQSHQQRQRKRSTPSFDHGSINEIPRLLLPVVPSSYTSKMFRAFWISSPFLTTLDVDFKNFLTTRPIYVLARYPVRIAQRQRHFFKELPGYKSF
jgi:hypothetical protein